VKDGRLIRADDMACRVRLDLVATHGIIDVCTLKEEGRSRWQLECVGLSLWPQPELLSVPESVNLKCRITSMESNNAP
jgi:hypothetical protein